MRNQQFRSFPFRSFPKEYMLGTGGINEILISAPPYSGHSQNTGNERERPETGELSGSGCNA